MKLLRGTKERKPRGIPELFDPYKLLYWRTKRNLSQKQLGMRMGMSETYSEQSISRYENALFRKVPQLPRKDMIIRMAAALDIEPYQLLSSERELRASMLAHKNRRMKQAVTRYGRSSKARMWRQVLEGVKNEKPEDEDEGRD